MITNYRISLRKAGFENKRVQGRGLNKTVIILIKKQRFSCAISDSTIHLSYLCPRREEARTCLSQTQGSSSSSSSLSKKPTVG